MSRSAAIASIASGARSRDAERLACLALCLLPGIALSEGAVKQLDCGIAQVCDAAGRCEAASGRVSFRMEPLDVDASGQARYTLRYEDVEAEMQAMSEAGPFFWTLEVEQDALLASSETQWLWHRLTFDPLPAATVRFLVCSFQQ